MRYTIDTPTQAIRVFGLGDRNAVDVALLIPLPDASASESIKFGRSTAAAWDTVPSFACFSAADGAAVVKWSPKYNTLDLSSGDAVGRVLVGYLQREKVIGMFGSNGLVWSVRKANINV
jgi:hypothetical protein